VDYFIGASTFGLVQLTATAEPPTSISLGAGLVRICTSAPHLHLAFWPKPPLLVVNTGDHESLCPRQVVADDVRLRKVESFGMSPSFVRRFITNSRVFGKLEKHSNFIGLIVNPPTAGFSLNH
jgi:hypothetical protein